MKTYSYIKIIVGIVALSSFFLTVDASASRKKPQGWGEDQGGDIPVLNESQEATIDSAQQTASDILFDAADWLDSFFDDGRATSEENKTRATIKLRAGYSRQDHFDLHPSFDMTLNLPKLSNRAHLIIEASEDTDFDIESDPLADRDDRDDDGGGEIRAALRYFFKETEKYNLSFDIGASWGYLYGSLRYRASHNIGTWQGRVINRLRWYTDDGWEDKLGYDLETHFSERFFFRSSSQIHWYEDEDGFPHSQKFKLYQVLDSLTAVRYETALFFETEPSYKMSDTQLILKYRKRFYRDWLVLELSPRITFPEDHDRDPNPGISIRFEAAIGYDADEEGYKKVFR